MNKTKNLCAAALLLCAMAAHADPTRWSFVFHGLYDEYHHVFDPYAVITGDFGGEDLDGDGTIGLSELTRFAHAGSEFLPPLAPPDPKRDYAVQRFVFDPEAGRLDFEITFHGTFPEIMEEAWFRVTTDEVYAITVARPEGTVTRNYFWTPQTTLTIAEIRPIPEPAQGAMLAAGLLGVAGLARVRRRRR